MPTTCTAATLVSERFCALMLFVLFEGESPAKSVAVAVAVQPVAPALASVIVTAAPEPPNAALAVNSESVPFRTAVPKLSGDPCV